MGKFVNCDTILQDLDESFPRGPWGSDREALDAILLYARNQDLGGGGWGVRFQAGLEGTKRRIGCCQAHSTKRAGVGDCKTRNGSDCRWGITINRGADGLWTVYSARSVHNHELCNTAEAALGGQKLLREGIPPDLERFGEMLSDAGIAASQINRVLQINAQKHQRPITWTYADVRTRFSPNTEELRADADSLISWIQMRREDIGLAGGWRTKEERFNGCWFLFAGGIEAYNAMGDKRVIFMDTTHNKNRFGMKLLIISCIGWSGNTEVIIFKYLNV